jgi:Mrp family chromosome partitioning ATPase
VANLALAFAGAGRRVAVVDLDLRRPTLEEIFGVDPTPGITDVALGEADLDDALLHLSVFESDAPAPAAHHENGHRAAQRAVTVIEFLPSGTLPPAPTDFMVTDSLAGVLEAMCDRVDLVLIDTPPLLTVGDARALSSRVDGVVIVTNVRSAHRNTLGEARRVLDASPVRPLGLILTGVRVDEHYGGYYGYRLAKKRGARREPSRAR